MASVLKVDKLDPQSGTALEIGTSGDTVSIPSGATLDISASTLTPPATMPASSGINFTALNATNLGSGTVPTARLGSGTASSSTVLYGDQTYKAEPTGGKIIGYQYSTDTTNRSGTAGSEAATGLTFAYTPSAATSRLFISMTIPTLTLGVTVSAIRVYFRMRTGTDTSGTELTDGGFGTYQSGGTLVHEMDSLQTYTFIHHPDTTSAQDYCLTVENSSGTPTWKVSGCDNGWTSTISILEIDGS